MPNVIITTNPFDLDEYVLHETDDLLTLLQEKFPVWPENARIYHMQVADNCDVTPTDERSIAHLSELEGTFYVVIYPGKPVFNLIKDVVSVAAFGLFGFLLSRNRAEADVGSQPSANNTLGDRSNKARPNSRIPDIFGQVRSIPDLITVPYRIYEDNSEIEISYMCVGRGQYDLDDIRDGETYISSIAGAGATFYGPGTSPNSGTAQLQIGSTITQDLYSVIKLNEVNGQTLKPPNNNAHNGSMRFVYPNIIEGSGSVDFTEFPDGVIINVNGAEFGQAGSLSSLDASVRFEDGGIIRFQSINPSTYFSVGQNLHLSNASYSGLDDTGLDYLFVDLYGTYVISATSPTTITLTTPAAINADWSKLVDYPSNRTEYKISHVENDAASLDVNLDGAFTVVSTTTTTMTLSNPDLVNPDWLLIDDFAGGATPYANINISTTGEVWIGWFDVDATDMDFVLFNIVALQGMYGINKKGEQFARTETAYVEMIPIAKDGTVLGGTETFTQSMTGSATEKEQVAMTIWATPATAYRYKARVKRSTPTDLDPKHQAIDEMKWESCYGLSVVEQQHFGDITTVFTRTYATQSATAVKERRFNLLATRKIPEWNGTALVGMEPQTSAAPIICAMALDPYIGNRAIGELNVQQIYEEIATLSAYFGFEESTAFSYTFDDDNVSFEETVQTAAQSVFANAYRVGNVIHLYGEMSDPPTILLFNHRNKLPKSETRTVTFGPTNDYDGIELTYIDPNDDVEQTIYLPSDQSARNAKKIETVGVRNVEQAMLHAYRTYNKIVYQNTTTQFDCLEEAECLINNNRILVADNTRNDTKDGYVKGQIGLVLQLSQPFVPTVGISYTIFLQHTDGTVEAIECEAGADQWQVVLAEAPALPLSLGDEQSVVAHYWIVGDNEPRASAFLMSEKEPSSKNTHTITAINYDERYYQNDHDFVDYFSTFDSTTITFDDTSITWDSV